MTIRTIANNYANFWSQTIRIFKEGEMTFCENAWEIPNKMTRGEFDVLMNTEFKTFEGTGVAIHFYIQSMWVVGNHHPTHSILIDK